MTAMIGSSPRHPPAGAGDGAAGRGPGRALPPDAGAQLLQAAGRGLQEALSPAGRAPGDVVDIDQLERLADSLQDASPQTIGPCGKTRLPACRPSPTRARRP